MRHIWLSDDHCVLDGMDIRVGKADFDTLKTTNIEVIVLKGRDFFQKYDQYLGDKVPQNILEIGIFEGGSAIIFADKWQDAKIVGVDIRNSNPSVKYHLERFGFDKRVDLHYNVSQDDASRIKPIIEAGFTGPIDLIIDDCSHQYQLSKASFELAFPYLAPGGLYIVEDWGWAHWRDFPKDQWAEMPALTNLLFELVMVSASSGWVISDIFVNGSFFAIKKAAVCPSFAEGLHIDNLYSLRGKALTQI